MDTPEGRQRERERKGRERRVGETIEGEREKETLKVMSLCWINVCHLELKKNRVTEALRII